MKFTLQVRTTRTRKCREGFYVLINGARLHVKTRRLALQLIEGWMQMQRVQIVTVREYVKRNRNKIAKQMG